VQFNYIDLPEAKDWEVGKDYEISLKVKQTSKSETDGDGSASFEVRAIAVHK